jgi:hypothetical protein
MDEKIGLRGVHYVAFREYCQLQALSVIPESGVVEEEKEIIMEASKGDIRLKATA